MQTLIELIERHAETDSDFRYYVALIEKAERNEIDHPDIAIECCVSLFQGVSKSIVYRLEPGTDRKAFENLTLIRQVNAALKCLSQQDDVIETEFSRRAQSLVQVLGELRNARGDISHGRAVPKELESDRSLSRLALNVSEAVLRYMLAAYFSIRQLRPPMVPYDENGEFNTWLDDQYPLSGKPLYSLALYQQYSEDYRIQLDLFKEREAGGVDSDEPD